MRYVILFLIIALIGYLIWCIQRFRVFGFYYSWRRWHGWIPIQFCFVCHKIYWGGLPRRGWLPCDVEYCSRKCCDIDMEMVDAMYEGSGQDAVEVLHSGKTTRGDQSVETGGD